MAETDVSHEFGREPGFSRSVFEWFLPWQFSYVTYVVQSNIHFSPAQIEKLGFAERT